MKLTIRRFGLLALLVGSLAGCGGGGSSGGGTGVVPPGPGPTNLAAAIAAAAADPLNDSAVNQFAAFVVLQNAGLPAVQVASPPKVHFTVFSDGAVVTGLTTSNVRFNLAKLTRGANGDPDDWANYVSRTETPTAGVGPGGTPVLASARQANTDSSTAAQLVYNADGYYTYTFSTDITDPTQTDVPYEPSKTHRIGIQLSYTNAAGKTVQVNPIFDFTLDASGNSVEVTDPALTRKVVDVTSCNQCHNRLALHGGGRIDPQYCVLCHNNGTTDANSGNVLELKTMVHKIHAGRLNASVGDDYVIWGYRDSKHDYGEVGFPQDLRNCTKCHDGNKAPQADNWKSKPTKQACLTCHQSGPGSDWATTHASFGLSAASNNSSCANCHGAGMFASPDKKHFNQAEANSAKYKMNIESVTYDSTTRNVTVKYFMADTTNGNAAWDLCGAPIYSSSNRLYVGYQNLPGQPTSVTEFSSYNNGGGSVRISWCDPGDLTNPVNDGSNHYTAVIPIPADIAGQQVAAGTARVISSGRVAEPATNYDGSPATGGGTVNVSVQNTYKDFAISGTLTQRRTVVSNDKCNACHSTLGTAAGSNTHLNAFHGGSRNFVEACVICHDPGRVSSGTVMADGSPTFNESYHFKRMIHGLHAAPTSVRTYPYTHDNTVRDSFDKNCVSTTDMVTVCSDAGDPTAVTNFAKEVAWPGNIADCNTCHVNDSWKQDMGVLGSVVVAGTAQSAARPMRW